MAKFIFIVGGARSGKSRFCSNLAGKMGKRVLFIATCKPRDSEMVKRVSLHKKSRPLHWKTVVEESDIGSILLKAKNRFDVIIVDCLGLFISNLLSKGLSDPLILKEIKSLAQIMAGSRAVTILVSNEAGEGLVPENPLARRFRDLLGTSNQIMARHADTVYVMHVGIPTKIKG